MKKTPTSMMGYVGGDNQFWVFVMGMVANNPSMRLKAGDFLEGVALVGYPLIPMRRLTLPVIHTNYCSTVQGRANIPSPDKDYSRSQKT